MIIIITTITIIILFIIITTTTIIILLYNNMLILLWSETWPEIWEVSWPSSVKHYKRMYVGLFTNFKLQLKIICLLEMFTYQPPVLLVFGQNNSQYPNNDTLWINITTH